MTAEQTLAEITRLYETFGNETYEEKCTQLQHAEQSGSLALNWGLDEELALAAFLHDIGHFIAQDQSHPDFTPFGYAEHDQLGANVLEKYGFSKRVCMLVGEHVQVKRYLAATEKGYTETLSLASATTLTQQGGPMSQEEAMAYANTPYLADIIILRKLDDSGKLPEMECQPLSYWIASAEHHLAKAC